MDALEFLKERKRMCNLCKHCEGCPLERAGCGLGTSASDEEYEKIIVAVEQWSKEHPCKTRQSVFLEQWPNCMMDDDDVVGMCPRNVDKMYECNGLLFARCAACRREFWMQEVK
jgi:hypothetical protein